MDIEHNFFGRQDILGLLKRRVVDLKDGYRQNIALLGNPYYGKSAILKHFARNIDDHSLNIIYLDLQDKDFSYFLRQFVTGLLYRYCKNHGLALDERLDVLKESARARIPHTIQVISRIEEDFQKGKPAAAYLGLLMLPEVFTNETQQFCILIIDEFQVFDQFDVPNIYQELGKKIMTQKRCFYVLASSHPALARRILSEKLSLLFGNFEMVNVGPFDAATSQRFIEHNLGDIKMGATLRGFLTDFTGGHPLYLNLICREINHLCALHKQSEAYVPVVSHAVENTLFDRWGIISRHFELLINDLCHGSRGSQTYAGILISLANGQHKPAQMAGDANVPRPQLTQKLNRLQDMGIIVKNGSFYYFRDKLFRYWVKFIYQRRLRDIDLSPDKRRLEYKEAFQASVEAFTDNSRKDFSARIMELFSCFDNESLQLNGRKYKLPLFREVVSLKIKNAQGQVYDTLKASAPDHDWLVILKKDSFRENEVAAILQESRKMTRKPSRCLLISLGEIDDHARLKALQEKFWIWHERELNTLLNLYDKPYIVR
jgi:hypothetical protein